MTDTGIICPNCGKQIEADPGIGTPRFCPYCGSPLSLRQPEETVPQGEPLEEGNEIVFAPGETTPKEKSNAVFCSEAGEPIFTGWLPQGYTGSAKLQQDPDDPASLGFWAYGQKDDKHWFYRKHKRHTINKLQATENPFRPFDAYMDEKAAEILGTSNIRLLKRVLPFKQQLQKMKDTLQQRRHQLESLNISNFIHYVIQAQYGALGGKLYEADVDGKKKYLLLEASMLADERGSYTTVQNTFNGTWPNAFQQSSGKPTIDADPNTPFGMHRTDGLSTSTISWDIFGFCGFQSDTLFTKDEIRDFYMSINSLRIDQGLQQAMDQQAIMIQTQTQQALQSTISQGLRSQQASFERSQRAIQSVNDFSNQMFQQRLANDNAALDKKIRQSHETIMGVNTFQRNDGSTIEIDVKHDRAYQNNNDPDILIGTSETVDLSLDWTELKKQK